MLPEKSWQEKNQISTRLQVSSLKTECTWGGRCFFTAYSKGWVWSAHLVEVKTGCLPIYLIWRVTWVCPCSTNFFQWEPLFLKPWALQENCLAHSLVLTCQNGHEVSILSLRAALVGTTPSSSGWTLRWQIPSQRVTKLGFEPRPLWLRSRAFSH